MKFSNKNKKNTKTKLSKKEKSLFKKIIKWGAISLGGITAFIILFIIILFALDSFLNPIDIGEQKIISEYYTRFDKVMLSKVWPITEYENYAGRKTLIESALIKISEAEAEISELENLVENIDNETFVSVNKKYLDTVKKLLEKEKELYTVDFVVAEFRETEAENDKIEELFTCITRCSCDKIDCDSYYESVIKHNEGVAETFESIDIAYIKESGDYFRQEIAVFEKHLPGLISKSKRYNENNCYKINDEYNEFYADLMKLDQIDMSKMEAEFNSRYDVPIDNLINEIDALSVDFDRVRAEVIA